MADISHAKDGSGNIVVASLNKLINWARSTSPWYFQFGLACCAIEMMATAASRHDLERIGMMPRSSPRQADVMIVAGTVTMKMALRVKRLYEQMANPKYVISMGSCATSGGPYCQYGYHVLKGVDLVVPVDVYIPGCPPRPEALIEGLLKLQEKILDERPIQDTVSKNLKTLFSKENKQSSATPSAVPAE
ncbi:MAG: NADH-quinone oxidoreductase subunit B [Candidatus Marinimicrobia bacterium]|nr:NADH-quinone oxidoreductase subunit B [Candidatus Neomarinimicrobiota bacterium]